MKMMAAQTMYRLYCNVHHSRKDLKCVSRLKITFKLAVQIRQRRIMEAKVTIQMRWLLSINAEMINLLKN